MTPFQFLIVTIAMTLLAYALQWLLRQRQVEKLRALAEELKLNYSEDDRFRLSPRIASHVPTVGAAAVRVFDLLYGVEESNYRYMFRTEYTIGVLRSKVSVQRVATFREPRDRAARDREIQLEYAPPQLPLLEQYRRLHAQARQRSTALNPQESSASADAI
jgi:hypothetical protein